MTALPNSNPGSISQKLVHKVRDILGDLSKSRIKNDVILYDLFSRYQREWMTQLNTTRKLITINITTATAYELDALLTDGTAVNKMIEVYDPADQTTNYIYKYDKHSNKIILSEETSPSTGDIIYVIAYVKPVEDIASDTDPVIGSDFEPYLIDAALTHFPMKDIPQTLENVENIRAIVRRQADAVKNRQRHKPGNLRQLNYY